VESLLDLLKLEGAIDVPVDVDDAVELSQYAAQTRYPGDWEPVTDEEADTAIAMAERVMAWAESQLGPVG
jgi:HEPN domain-containing protein